MKIEKKKKKKKKLFFYASPAIYYCQFNIFMPFLSDDFCRADRFTWGLSGSVGCIFNWSSDGQGFDPRRVWQCSLVENDHEIFCWFKKGSFPFRVKECAQVLGNCLED